MFFLQMSGFPGAGKSTLAQLLAKRTGCIVVDHDVTKSGMMQSGKVEANVAGPVAYDVDFALVNYYLAQGRSVILDSPCLYIDILQKGQALAATYNAAYKYIECVVDDVALIENRLQTRTRMPSQITTVASKEGYERTLAATKRPESGGLIVNTSKPIETYFNQALDYISI